MEIICTALGGIAAPNPSMLKVINKQNKAGNTALHWAALNGKLDAVKILFKYGADLTIKNERGRDAILEALLNDKNEIVEWAVKTGVKDLQIGDGDDGEEEVAGNEDIKMESSGDMIKSGDAKDGIIDELESGLAEDGGAEVVDADSKNVDGVIEELDQLKVEDEKED
jgi:ankyrin repeat protein